MGTSEPSQVTQILADLDAGDPQAAQKLLPLVYEELRKLAHQRLRNEPQGLTLQPTALVHEAYLRLVGDDASSRWDNRGHFFAAAAEAMRRILVERARKYGRQTHGGGRTRIDLDKVAPAGPGDVGDDIIALDDAPVAATATVASNTRPHHVNRWILIEVSPVA